jgi:signal transduction histidine kinase
MTTTPAHIVLEKAEAFFSVRDLRSALLEAHALAISDSSANPKILFNTLLLLARTYTHLGRFEQKQEYFISALDYTAKAAMQAKAHKIKYAEPDTSLVCSTIYLHNGPPEKAFEQLELALQCSEELGYEKGVVQALTGFSQYFIQQNDFVKALEFAQQALNKLADVKEKHINALLLIVYDQLVHVFLKRQEYSRIPEYSEPLLDLSQQLKDVEKEITALNAIAIVHGIHSDYQPAMQHFLEAFEKSSRIQFRSQIANSLINIGTIYAHLFNYEAALERYEEALHDYHDVLNANTLIITYNNVGNIYLDTGQHETALEYFHKSLGLSEKTNYREMIAHSLAQICRVQIALNQYGDAAISAGKASVLISSLSGDFNGRQINLLNLAQISFQQREYDLAIRQALSGVAVARRLKDETGEIRGFHLLSDIYKVLKNYQKSLKCYAKYAEVQASYANVQRHRLVIDMEIRHSIREKQRKIEQLTKENEYQALLLEKSDQIEKQNFQLLQANEELRQFAYIASHDLKEPLRMIGSFTQLLFKNYRDKLDEESGVFFEYIHEGVTRMNKLLDGLLQYATIGKFDSEYETVDLNDVVEICKSNLKLKIDESVATVESQWLPEIVATQSLMIQLFQNLISNALKFQQPEVAPHIHIATIERADDNLFCIKDNGIGIAPEHNERIFVIFQRLHGRNRYEGTGIGLAICHKIVTQLGGRIWVDSSPGNGAAFYFTLPKNKGL